jgi:hypothetical protein
MSEAEYSDSYKTLQEVYCEDKTGGLTNTPCAWIVNADIKIAKTVLAAKVGPEGRSKYVWVRLACGALLLGVFPTGDTYIETEADPNRP